MLEQAPAVYRLIRVAKQVGHFTAERLAPLGLHPGQERLLAELWAEDGLSQSDLVVRLAVSAPTVSAALTRLQREGFVTRQPDAANRRVSRVYLTDRGRNVEESVRAIFAEAELRFLADLSKREKETLIGLVDRVGPPG